MRQDTRRRDDRAEPHVIQGLFRRAVGAAHRIVHPQYSEERARLDEIERTILHSAASQQQQIDRLTRALEAVSARVETLARDRHLRGLDRRVEGLRDASTRQYKALSQALKFASWDEELRIDERRLARRLERLRKSTAPVLVGPWTGEVGFELLYWIPFVTWVLRETGISRDRIVVVSRGGAEPWYAHLHGRYLDVLSCVDVGRFRAQTAERKKQRTMGPFDREIVRLAIERAGLGRPVLLHPGLMYRLFTPFWKQKATVRRIETYTSYQRLGASAIAALAGRLPSEYVAVRFYFSSCFPDTPANRAFVQAAVAGLAESTNVVLLNTGFRIDDHEDFGLAPPASVHTIDDLMTPARNLDVQTAVIAGAKAFVGTYGGYSYLAPLCGVPSLAFYSRREEFFAHHLELAERVFRSMNAGALVPLDVRDVGILRMALGPVATLRS
ncbi:MAG TPA: hypothetical protein VKB50_29120 [Vicinamibacterales bacterium]|nr:hypothetical protein [Vicinamibacterales bacterium]